MLRYKTEIHINKPIDKVLKVFADRTLLFKWQPGLLSSEQVESYPYPKYKLLLDFGRRKIVMTETIVRNELPMHFDGTYEMKGIFNRNKNTFINEGPDKTLWTCESEFRFSGVMRIVAFFMKDGLKKQSEMMMNNFKRYVEAM
jgi:hypothetical protein